MLDVRSSQPRVFAGLDLGRPRIMGIINVTPDSFSDGGDFATAEAAVAEGLSQLEQGADILDVGGESTRPGSDPVPVDEEIRRIRPVVRALARADALVSIDTRRAAVMRVALDEGARIVNDVTALTHDRAALPLVAASGAAVVLMHMRGDPKTMQVQPRYADVVGEVRDYLAARAAACAAAGLPADRIAVDPGIGFGKTVAHNLQLMANLERFTGLGAALLVGISRKSTIAKLSRGEAPKDRLPGSLAGALAAVARGARIVRVHDVGATRQALAVWQAIEDQG